MVGIVFTSMFIGSLLAVTLVFSGWPLWLAIAVYIGCGVLGLALMAAVERELRAKKSPIRASVLCPGPINTNISRHSVEYRPGKAKPKADGENAGKMASNIQSILEDGMDPNEVGELVANAIAENKFWILTHPRWAKTVQKQLDAMVEDQSLTRA